MVTAEYMFGLLSVVQRRHCYLLCREVLAGRLCIATHGICMPRMTLAGVDMRTCALHIRCLRCLSVSVLSAPVLVSFDKRDPTRLAAISYDLLNGFPLHCVFVTSSAGMEDFGACALAFVCNSGTPAVVHSSLDVPSLLALPQLYKQKQTNSVAFSPPANYTD
jgi:hypothetical protein